MHKKLQQFKNFFSENPLLIFCILFIVFLPIYSGEIVLNTQAFILGRYINYLHIRISLHLLLSIAVSFLYFRRPKNKSLFLFFLSTFIAGVALSIPPIKALSNQIGNSFIPLFFSSVFHFSEFLLLSVSFLIATGELLSANQKAKSFLFSALTISICIQLVLGILQFLLKAPLFPSLLSWTGQPLEFTSKSIIGVFEYARIYGTTPHPNIFAGILAYYTFLILSISENTLLRNIIIFGMFALALGTLSKSGLLALLTVYLIFLARKWLNQRKMKKSILLVLFLVANCLIIIGLYFITLPGISATFIESRSIIERLYLELIARNPLFLLTGTGFTMAIANLLAQSYTLSGNIIWGNQILAEPPHNILILGVLELGIPVFLLYGYSIVQLIRNTLMKTEPWQLFTLLSLLIILGGLDHYLVY